ncbi:hypothetical protein FNW02_09370 [Komarekiella sp. 'clone 1']|uniref:Uncharacterized protein n=1 Tax=Komarekiella delphini-convector SJRDD-AB1 TaxID=2593771 RepID=A0AA40SVG5_9NOST|nr:hypothetical protein [Komarekiella delphini-convector SJRDD-AB1]
MTSASGKRKVSTEVSEKSDAGSQRSEVRCSIRTSQESEALPEELRVGEEKFIRFTSKSHG